MEETGHLADWKLIRLINREGGQVLRLSVKFKALTNVKRTEIQ